ncbi:MAG: type II toxin-antitoxin system PemK/MazF family toxin [Kofleriaceae bacterium]
MKRNEIWWAKLPAPVGRRPVVLVSRDLAYVVRTSVTVVEVTTRIRNLETEVPLGARDGLPKRCVANADNLHTIPRAMLESRIGTLSPDKVLTLDRALALSLGR